MIKVQGVEIIWKLSDQCKGFEITWKLSDQGTGCRDNMEIELSRYRVSRLEIELSRYRVSR